MLKNSGCCPSLHNLPLQGNPYATNNLVYTGPGRQAIVDKLNRIRLASVSYGDNSGGLPLSEVLRDLTEKVQANDPDKKGINFSSIPIRTIPGRPWLSADWEAADCPRAPTPPTTD